MKAQAVWFASVLAHVAVSLGSLTVAVILSGESSVAQTDGSVPYDIIYVRQPRFGDDTNTTWPEVFHPARIDPGADLVLLHPDGSEEVLVAGGVGAVTDPFLSFDAEWVYYSYFYDMRPQAINSQRNLPYGGSDIFRLHLGTRQIEQLTFGEFTPNTGAGHYDESDPVSPGGEYDSLGYGILNLGPAPVAGGKIAFTSNRNGFLPPKGFTHPTLQLFVMDEDGGNVSAIAPMNISSALHPVPLRDGRLMFSTHESQALRDRRLWGFWSIYPDGRHWAPVVSAFRSPQAFHFATQLSNEDLVVVDYYNLNNNGFGALYRLPARPPAGTPPFFSAFPQDNPSIQQTVGGGFLYPFRMPFTPWGMFSITPFTHGNDEAAPIGASGARVGKFTLQGAGVYRLGLASAVNAGQDLLLSVEVSDQQGNVTRVRRRFSIEPVGVATNTPTATATPTPTSTPTGTPTSTPTSTQRDTPTSTPADTPTVDTQPSCRLDVDGSGGPPDVPTDLVYIARRLVGLPPVPSSFRTIGPPIADDVTIAANVDVAIPFLDVDGRGGVGVESDLVYISRRLLGLAAVPSSFRSLDPTIPSDVTVAAVVDALCPTAAAGL